MNIPPMTRVSPLKRSFSPIGKASNEKALDRYNKTQTAAAYALLRLKSNVSKVIRVHRSSDDAEMDIGCIGENLDTATLLAFCGSGSGYVATWYDQSGNGNHATQATVANMPRIVNAGVIDKDAYGKVTMVFTKTLSSFLKRDNVTINPLSVVSVQQSNGNTATYQTIFRHNSATQEMGVRTNNGGTTYSPYRLGANNVSPSVTTTITNKSIWSVTLSNSDNFAYINGVQGDTKTRANTFVSSIGNALIGSSNGTGEFWDGIISEVLVFSITLTYSQRQRIERNQGKYYGITVT